MNKESNDGIIASTDRYFYVLCLTLELSDKEPNYDLVVNPQALMKKYFKLYSVYKLIKKSSDELVEDLELAGALLQINNFVGQFETIPKDFFENFIYNIQTIDYLSKIKELKSA